MGQILLLNHDIWYISQCFVMRLLLSFGWNNIDTGASIKTNAAQIMVVIIYHNYWLRRRLLLCLKRSTWEMWAETLLSLNHPASPCGCGRVRLPFRPRYEPEVVWSSVSCANNRVFTLSEEVDKRTPNSLHSVTLITFSLTWLIQ